MTHQPAVTLIAAFILAVLAVARIARLITSDAYPPVAVLREKWTRWQAERDYDPVAGHDRIGVAHGWGPLFTCPFCLAPYLAAIDLAWVLLSGLSVLSFWAYAWWVCNAWAAIAYLAGMVVVRDEG